MYRYLAGATRAGAARARVLEVGLLHQRGLSEVVSGLLSLPQTCDKRLEPDHGSGRSYDGRTGSQSQ